ncbi:MAG: translation initiation factor IF-1 [Candidatus Doudnabacteria bacterium]|nr:translation initiation factor IF-1 [Candidatus Doudnabacteria bacterium]
MRKFKTNSRRSPDFGKQQPIKDVIELEGKIVESLPNALFRVQLEAGQTVLGHLAGKMRVNMIRVLPGDRVIIEMTPYDLNKGRIIRRLR